MKDQFIEILSDFEEAPLPDMHKRDVDLPINSGKIITLIGPRRSGKSFCLLQTVKELLQKGVKKECIVFINFEDERLNLKTHHLDDILKAYREFHPEIKTNTCYFFFDEIQNIPGWDKFVRRCYDTVSRNIFLTGSNAHLLSSEISTSLRGRTVTFEILPLSFKEYLKFKGITYSKKDAVTQAKVTRALKSYLANGGFPEVVLSQTVMRNKILQEYFDVMIYRDLVQRYGFTNLVVVKYFLKRLAASTCSYVSLNKVYNDLRSQGYKLDKNLLYAINEAAKAVYLSMPIKKFDYSELKTANSDSKNYCVDNGLYNALNFTFDDNAARLLENAVYLHFRRQQAPLFYYKNGKECDFVVVNDKTKTPLPVQVCYDMRHHTTRDREINGLLHCCKSLNIKKGLIVTMNEAESFTKDKIKIEVVKVTDLLL